jgi:hypothetical protein
MRPYGNGYRMEGKQGVPIANLTLKARRELLEMWGIYPSLRGASSSDAPTPFSLERKNVGVKKLRSLTMPLPSSGSL